MNKNNQKKRGFTLVEFLLYSIIVTTIIGALTTIGINIMKVRTKVGSTEEVNYNGKMILNEIMNYVRKAESITYPLQGEEGYYLTLEMPLGEDTPISFTSDAESNILVQIGTEDPAIMNSGFVSIEEMKFSNVSYLDSPETLKMEIIVAYRNPTEREEYSFQKTFYSAENIRVKE